MRWTVAIAIQKQSWSGFHSLKVEPEAEAVRDFLPRGSPGAARVSNGLARADGIAQILREAQSGRWRLKE